MTALPAPADDDASAALVGTLSFTADGLIPAIAQQHDTGEVLMMAWMDAASLRLTLQTGWATYWSRSRGELWRKGETSGNLQRVLSVAVDCDRDTLLLQVDQTGPACHTETASCFTGRIVAEPQDPRTADADPAGAAAASIQPAETRGETA